MKRLALIPIAAILFALIAFALPRRTPTAAKPPAPAERTVRSDALETPTLALVISTTQAAPEPPRPTTELPPPEWTPVDLPAVDVLCRLQIDEGLAIYYDARVADILARVCVPVDPARRGTRAILDSVGTATGLQVEHFNKTVWIRMK